MEELNFQVVTSNEALSAAVDRLSKCEVIGFDTETTSLSPWEGRVRLLQLAAPEVVYVFDLDRFADGDARKAEALAPLRRLLAAPRPVKVAHNAKFDVKWVGHYLGAEVGGVFDSLLASQLISAGEQEDRHNLEAVAGRFLGESLDKSEQLSDWGGELSESQLRYAARDAAVMLPLRERMIARLRADELVRCAQLEFECVAPVADLELAGIFLDRGRWREVLGEVEKKRATLAEELQEMLAEGTAQGSLFANARADINLDSHTQLTAALKRLGVPVPDSTRNWKLQPLAKDYPVVAKLLEYRTVQKALTSYGANILEEINPKTGRIHADFHQIGAPTGRFSCLAGDALVSTSVGLKRMDAVCAGDYVATTYGLKKVERAWITGVRPVYKVRLQDGREIRATADHRFLANQADYWKRLDELSVGEDLFVSLRHDDGMTDSVPPPLPSVHIEEIRARKSVKVPTELSVPLCELMGLIIADGFLGRRHERPAPTRGRFGGGSPAVYDRVCLAFHREDQELINYVCRIAEELFGQSFKEVKSQTCRVLQLASTKLAQFFAGLGLQGKAHTKSVPDIVLGAGRVFQAAFLRGLFEGDGHRGGNNIGLMSVNHALLMRVQIMLAHLGIYSTVRRRSDTSGFAGRPRFSLSVDKKTNVAKFMSRVGFLTTRKNQPFKFVPRRADGVATPFIISGAQLYREAVAAGTTVASRLGVKPFIGFYRGACIKPESVARLTSRFGSLPSLAPVQVYVEQDLRAVKIVAIEPDGEAPVYDITVEDVHEFVANSIVVHNCTRPNIQQVPHSVEYRRCFRAPEGRKLVISDYSQIELRILAQFTGDQGFIDAFQTGADLHRVTAAQVFNVAPDEVTSEQRSFAKRLNFGVVYGIGAQRFSMMTGLSLTEAEDILRRYFATYRALDMWLRDAARQAVRERTAPRTVAGRLARFNFDAADKQAVSLVQRNGKNSPIQGCVHGETRIFVEGTGYVRIKDVVDREVSVWDGQRFSRARVARSGRKQLVKMSLWGGHYIECSPDHKFLTIDANGRRWWRTPTEMKRLNWVALTDAIGDWKCDLRLPATRPGKAWNASRASLADISDPFELGVYLGRTASDGSVCGRQVDNLVAEHEKDILPYMLSIVGQLGHVTFRPVKREANRKPLYQLTNSSLSVAGQLLDVGIKTRIPDPAWADRRVLAGYLCGMFDGDGTVNKDGPALCFGRRGTHLAWAREIQQALLLFGIRSRINVCADRINVRVLKRDAALFAKSIGFINPDKQRKLLSVVPQRHPAIGKIYGRAARVKSVEVTDEWVEMYDVVDSETERFMANGLVTHNSSADILKRALRLLHDKLRGTTARVVNIVHDEVVVEADASQAEEIAKTVEKAMCAAGEEYVKAVPIKVESEIADDWVKG